ncbi:metabolite traffic protein EboE [filamentous cyanobacterium LEGE 11480]|uniref:Metabolite traffic protein EboE n=1 Tax=Romeriopsis navalis LEGE 11480 TaxID=2777977 RepID=A0A928Z1T4_9CYAN|nr:metabolite traffic protein EboE [Romeriopsis navalis]MBE9028819.1 metabolite traffic protein EboE [Romeriopsis navalis LEGE 11480]
MKVANSPFHLTYCTNIHPGETWAEVWHNLQTYLPQLKQRLSPNAPLGIGLRLADCASREILQGDNLGQLQQWLLAQDLYVFTLNGFPYGSFHHQVVKDQVYAPDWFTDDRLAYTQRLVRILAALLPDEIEGSISTLPISYKPWWSNPAELELNNMRAARQLATIADDLANLYASTGKKIHLGLEPEPDGLIENSQEVIAWFDRYLLPVGSQVLQRTQGLSYEATCQMLLRHIQVCYDTCHFAVEFEDPIVAIERLTNHGIGLSKIQLSAAVRFAIPAALDDRQQLVKQLQPFAESTYLHQVIARQPDGQLERFRDLEQALPYLLDTTADEWRTHFHVPLFIRDYPAMSSTQADIQTVLNYLKKNPVCQHLEIETYTWEVLPNAMKLDITTSIQREYEWVLGVLNGKPKPRSVPPLRQDLRLFSAPCATPQLLY